MEPHLKHIYIQSPEPEQDISINADKEPEKAEKHMQNIMNDIGNDPEKIDKQDEIFIKSIEMALDNYDRMIVEEVKTREAATNVGRLIIERKSLLTDFMPEKDISDFYRYEKAISRCNMLKEKLDYKLDELKNQPNKSDTICFETDLDDNGRLSVYDEILANMRLKTVEAKNKRVFVGVIHKPTFMYLLGGECPTKIIKLNMVSHPKMYKFLMKYTSHKFNDIDCFPVKIRKEFFPLLLNDSKGKRIVELHNNNDYQKK